MSDTSANDDQQNTSTPHVRWATRCAEIIFALCGLLLVATVALNRALTENREEFQRRSATFDEIGSMLGRYRAYRALSPEFFEGITTAAVTWPPGDADRDYPSLAILGLRIPEVVRNAGDGSRLFVIPDPKNAKTQEARLRSTLEHQAQDFGQRVSVIVANEKMQSRRLPLIEAAITQVFVNKDAQRLLKKTALARLSRVDDSAEWPAIREWIAYGYWPLKGGVSSGSPLPGTSYSDRFIRAVDLEMDKYVVYQDLIPTREPAHTEELLLANWRSAYADLKATPYGAPQIGVPGGALLRVTDLVLLGGPIVVLFQVFFLVFWVRSFDQNGLPTPFAFPVFGSPPDPTERPIPRTLPSVAERVTWLAFLTLPAVILIFAAMTRYDVSVFGASDWSPPPRSWLAQVSLVRSHDRLSVMLDVANLLALFLSMITVIGITTVHQKAQRWTRRQLIAFVPLVGVFLSLLWLYVRPWHVDLLYTEVGPAPLPDLLFWSAYGMVWTLVLPLAMRQSARLATIMSLGGILLFVGLLLPR